MGDTIENEIFGPEKKRKILRRPSLMAIGIIIAIGLGAFNTFAVTGLIRHDFPSGSSLFSIESAYSFASPTSDSQVLTPGSTGTVTLKIVYRGTTAASAMISFNTTTPALWGGPGQGCPDVQRDLAMTLNAISIFPENSDLFSGQSCGSHYAAQQSAQVSIQPGTNLYTGTITVSSTAQIASTEIHWFASQA